MNQPPLTPDERERKGYETYPQDEEEIRFWADAIAWPDEESGETEGGVTEAMNRVCNEAGLEKDEFASATSERILRRIEWS